MKVKLKLTAVVEYETEPDEIRFLRENLGNVIDYAADNGMLTGSCNAEVETFEYRVVEVKE